MLSPKRTLHRKQMKGRMKGIASRGNSIAFGEFGIQALEKCWLTARQIEAARIAMTRKIKRGGRVWIRVFPHLARTKKPAEVRMGSGKGSPEGWAAVVEKGRVIFEIGGIDPKVAQEALRLAGYKLPVKTKVIKRTKALSQAELIKMEAAHESSLEEIEKEDEIEKVTVSDTGNEQAPAEEADANKEAK